MVEKRHAGPANYNDWGIWANVFLGAVAAVAALWIFPPEIHTTVEDDGGTTSVSEYDLTKVVGLSLIVGSAGSSALSALQARALVKMKEQEAEVTRKVADEQLETIKGELASGTSDAASVTTSIETAQAAIRATRADSSGQGNPSEADF